MRERYWKRCFEGLLNVSEERSTGITVRPGIRVRVIEKAYEKITKCEVEKVLKKLKIGKIAGLKVKVIENLKS